MQDRAGQGKPSGQGMHKCYMGVVDLGNCVTRCVLRKESCVLSVAREGTVQRVAAMRQMEKGNCVSDGRASGSNDWRSCGATSGRNFKKRGQHVNQVDYDIEE